MMRSVRVRSSATKTAVSRKNAPPSAHTKHVMYSADCMLEYSTKLLLASPRPCQLFRASDIYTTHTHTCKGGNVTSAGWQVTLCDSMWHVSSRSGVATLRTAIHLLLTYLHIRLTAIFSGATWMSRYQKGKTNLDFTERLSFPFLASVCVVIFL